MTQMQIVNRVMAGLLAVLLGPMLAKADVHLSAAEYATLATVLGVVLANIYHWCELRFAAAPSAPRLTATDLTAICSVVLTQLNKEAHPITGALESAPPRPIQPPATPAPGEKP